MSIENLTGSRFNDTLIGNEFTNVLRGEASDDTLQGGRGDDTLDGGGGTDTALYSGLAGVRVDLNLTSAQNTGGAGIDTLVSIENLSGSVFNDVLYGNSLNNAFEGRAGHDRLVGAAGDDQLNGGSGRDGLVGDSGNDTLNGGFDDDGLTGGPGDDRLDGGFGIDIANYLEIAAAVRVDLRLTGAQNTGGAGIDTLLNIEDLWGTLTGDDHLTGNDADNEIRGIGGNDVLSGLGGNDFLRGDFGDDILRGGSGDDDLTGGSGTDLLDGGKGRDSLFDDQHATFYYNSVIDSLPGRLNRDVILSFDGTTSQIDLIDIDANALVAGNQAFTYIGSAAFATFYPAGQLRYADGLLQGNIDADADAEIEIELLGAPSLIVGGVGTDILL